jgi:hypothetical protein
MLQHSLPAQTLTAGAVHWRCNNALARGVYDAGATMCTCFRLVRQCIHVAGQQCYHPVVRGLAGRVQPAEHRGTQSQCIPWLAQKPCIIHCIGQSATSKSATSKAQSATSKSATSKAQSAASYWLHSVLCWSHSYSLGKRLRLVVGCSSAPERP